MSSPLRIGFVPEHFSTPLRFAENQKYYQDHGISDIQFIEFPSGTGSMIEALKDGSVDICVGLTEAFIAGIGKGLDFYRLIGTYVESPLCWSISTGSNRADIKNQEDIRGKSIGVSRIGSGSYVMPFVLALQQHWTEPFEFVPQGKFNNLRDGVNHASTEKPTDAFMWEYFTTKKYYDNGEIKKVGEIYTPWPSWVIVASTKIKPEIYKSFLRAVDQGIEYFNQHNDEAVEYISNNLDYSAEDAREWLKTVQFTTPTTLGVKNSTVNEVLKVLNIAKVLDTDDAGDLNSSVLIRSDLTRP